MFGWIDGRTDGRTDGWTDGRMRVWSDVLSRVCRLIGCGVRAWHDVSRTYGRLNALGEMTRLYAVDVSKPFTPSPPRPHMNQPASFTHRPSPSPCTYEKLPAWPLYTPPPPSSSLSPGCVPYHEHLSAGVSQWSCLAGLSPVAGSGTSTWASSTARWWWVGDLERVDASDGCSSGDTSEVTVSAGT